MSFILDALKKSENERQRADAPALYEMKMAPPRRGVAVWLLVLAGLLVINVIVLSVVLLRGNHGAAPQTETTPAVPAAPAPAAAMGAPPSVSPPPNAVPSQPVMAAAPAAAPPAPAADTASNPADDAPAVEPSRAAAAPAPAPVRRADNSDDTADVPSYQQAASVPGASLPDLKLDLHAYAANPADRFIFLNMTKLAEGQSNPAGVRVESITPDGAILSWQGSKFFLQRQ